MTYLQTLFRPFSTKYNVKQSVFGCYPRELKSTFSIVKKTSGWWGRVVGVVGKGGRGGPGVPDAEVSSEKGIEFLIK